MQTPKQLLWKHINAQQKQWALIIATGLLNNLSIFIISISVGDFFELVYHNSGSKEHLLNLFGLHASSLKSFITVFIALLIIRMMTTYMVEIKTTLQGELFAKNIREFLFAQQVNASPLFFQQKSYGSYLLRYSNDMKSIQAYITKGWLEGIRYGLFLLMGIALMTYLNPVFGIGSALILCLLLLLFFGWWNNQQSLVINSRNKRSGMLSFVTRQFAKHARISSNGKQDKTIESFIKRSADLYLANKTYKSSELLIQAMISIVPGVLLLFLFGVVLVFGGISYPTALVLVLVIFQMQSAIRRILKIPSTINKGKISLQKIAALQPTMHQHIPSVNRLKVPMRKTYFTEA